jgi:predicted aminopeptidase
LTKLTRADRLAAIVEKERELRQHMADHEVMTKAVDGARVQMENGLTEQAYATQEVSGQVRIVKDRQKWLIDRQDKLKADIEKLRGEIE